MARLRLSIRDARIEQLRFLQAVICDVKVFPADVETDQGKALPCGHYLSDEAPEETYRELRAFFTAA